MAGESARGDIAPGGFSAAAGSVFWQESLLELRLSGRRYSTRIGRAPRPSDSPNTEDSLPFRSW